MRRTLSGYWSSLLICAASGLLSCGCSTDGTPRERERVITATKPTDEIKLPSSAAPAAELAPLGFMVGRWIGVNPNKTVNEEHWTKCRGNHMVGTFHQIRRDGKPAFVEVSLVTVEDGEVTLRLRHLHSALEVPENQKEVSVFTLESAGGNRAEFVGTGSAEQVTGVVYRLTDSGQLAVDVSFAATSKEKGFTSIYTRE